MKKTFLAAMALIVAFAFTSCDPVEKSKEELLTQKKGWIITQATCTPDYQLNNDEWVDTDLLNGGFFFDCEKDDIYFFNSDKSFVRNFGSNKCEGEDGKEENMGRWAFQENDTWVQFYMTAYYDFDNEEYFKLRGIIKELDETTLRLEVPIDETNELAKAKQLSRGEVHPFKGIFYLTFKVK
jgi:hypothetical protein